MISKGKLLVTFGSQVFWQNHPLVFKYNPQARRRLSVGIYSPDDGKSSPLLTRLLIYLVDHANTYHTPEEIFEEVWAHRDLTDLEQKYLEGYDPRTNVRHGISLLRRTFLSVDPSFNHIKHRNGVGYAWDTGAREGLKEWGDLSIHLDMYEVHWKGHLIPLRPMEVKAVHILASKSGELVPAQRLVNTASVIRFNSPARPEAAAVSLLCGIRKKFRQYADPSFDAIRCSYSFGYTWRP